MAEILRDVIIKPPLIRGKNMIIKGIKGGELKFSLIKWASINFLRLKNNEQPLVVSCYRTKNLDYIDVLSYNGHKNASIKLKVDSESQDFIKDVILYIISPDQKLIEYGRLERHNGAVSGKLLFEYKTKTSHQFREVKIVCYEILNS